MDTTTIIRILAGILFLLLCLLYFYPTFKALGKRNTGAIFALNLLTGWSMLGWLVSLIWGLKNDAVAVRPDEVQQFARRDRQIKIFIYTLWSIAAIILAVAMVITSTSPVPQPKTQQSTAADQSDQQQSTAINQQSAPVLDESSKPATAEPPPADTTPADSQGETALDNVKAEVSRALDNWAKAYESNDPTLIANCYADQVDRYFLRQNVTSTFVHDYMDAWLKEHDSRVTIFKIKDVTFENETDATVTLRLVKEVVTTDTKGAAERFTPSQLSLKKVAGEWKITSERDFK